MIFVAAFGLVIAALLSVGKKKLTGEQLVEMKGYKFNNFFEVKVIPIAIVCAVIYFCYSSTIAFLTVYSKEINLVDAASFFFIVYAIVIFFSRPFIGRLFDILFIVWEKC
ncbi:MAG: hypothetical protein PHO01_08845 [Desulfotomaculaceae bacterium]|nr:hypothetical protein [Desulfotomaculaceae bacterium]